MADKTAPDALSGLTNKEVDAKVADAKSEGHTAGKAEADAAAKTATDAAIVTAKAEAVKAERERVKAITSMDEAKGREAAALSLALTTDMGAEQVKSVLAALPKTDAAASGTRSSDSPIGLAGVGEKKAGGSADVLSPDEVAAAVNKRK